MDRKQLEDDRAHTTKRLDRLKEGPTRAIFEGMTIILLDAILSELMHLNDKGENENGTDKL